MELCNARNHEPIVHNEYECPLCAALTDWQKSIDEVARLKEEINDLRMEIDNA